MKMFKKNKLEYRNGYIVTKKKGKIVNVDNEVVDLLNQLEEDIQRAMYEKTTRVECNEVKEFKRSSCYDIELGYEVETPTLDAMAEKALKIMEELDDSFNASQAEARLESIKPVVQFINDDFVVSCEQATQHRFDLPIIGNPLDLNLEELITLVGTIYA